jgi:hypothetical protein
MSLWRRSAWFVVVGVCLFLSSAAGALAKSSPTAGLKNLLPRAGELTGFRASGLVLSFNSIAKDVAADPAALRASDAMNLTRDGFVVELAQDQVGTGVAQTYATSGLTRLGSHAQAEAYDRFTFAVVAKPGPVAGTAAQVRFVRFSVPGVPGATGVAELTRAKKVAHANVQWVEGSCMIQVGDGVASKTALTQPLIHAAQAIFKRTRGACAP